MAPVYPVTNESVSSRTLLAMRVLISGTPYRIRRDIVYTQRSVSARIYSLWRG
ncbi:hypothetical protein [uncultured Duncaniella sp.]|uniref:hypothetical protein n=1 Tax=uncultured Duncaniella sp. TaxID=2768039 RepID=UPI00265F1F78|nr:hypothetical protein [uncultured Duncaniella sp.]